MLFRSPYVPADLRRNSVDCLAQYVACGLDPDTCTLFLQSHVTGHTELAWILGCLCPLGKLERMTQFKDKARSQLTRPEASGVGASEPTPDSEEGSGFSEEGSGCGDEGSGFVGSGLLTYPVLMAADILLYNADRVPVGEDQKQHLELTRDLAVKFNSTYSETFKVPEVDIPKTGARVMSLQDPTRKMSKSDPNPSGCLYLVDEPKVLRKKVMSAVTDSDTGPGCVRAAETKPGITNLLGITASLTGETVADLEERFADATYADFKTALADSVVEALTPIRERYLQLKGDKKRMEHILADGAAAAQRRANRMLAKVRRKVGLVELPQPQ